MTLQLERKPLSAAEAGGSMREAIGDLMLRANEYVVVYDPAIHRYGRPADVVVPPFTWQLLRPDKGLFVAQRFVSKGVVDIFAEAELAVPGEQGQDDGGTDMFRFSWIAPLDGQEAVSPGSHHGLRVAGIVPQGPEASIRLTEALVERVTAADSEPHYVSRGRAQLAAAHRAQDLGYLPTFVDPSHLASA